MKKAFGLAWFAMVFLQLTSWGIAVRSVEIGMSRDEMLIRLGKPEKIERVGLNAWFDYGSTRFFISKDKVAHIVQGDTSYVSTLIEGPGTEKIRYYLWEGAAIHPRHYVVEDAVTIVVFFAEWNRNSVKAVDRLKKFVRETPGVHMRVIDIHKWGSAVCAQYDLSYVPNMRIFNSQGGVVGADTHSVSEVRMRIYHMFRP